MENLTLLKVGIWFTILIFPLIINASEKYSVVIYNSEITTGNSVMVTWQVSGGTSFSSNDWVGLYRTGASNSSYLQWSYVKSRTGSKSFQINSPGEYEIRYLLNNGYTVAKVSEKIVVTEQGGGGGDDGGGGSKSYFIKPNKSSYNPGEIATVTWNAPNSSNIFLDWIGLYEANTSDRSYISYVYVNRLFREVYFPLNRNGVFEFRYFKNNSYTKVATSERFMVSVNETGNFCNGYDLNNIKNLPSKVGPIIALGDSITVGIGASEGQNYVDELEKSLQVKIINQGVSSDTTLDILQRLERDVLSENPSTVIVFAGGNDEIRRLYESLSQSAADRALANTLDRIVRERFGYEWQDVPLLTRKETFSNLEEIVTRIQATGANTIVVGFDNTLFNDMIYEGYENVATETGSIFIPNIYERIFGRPSRMSDLVHPNDAGYDIVADRIARGLECVI